jgi:hypothetical protein
MTTLMEQLKGSGMLLSDDRDPGTAATFTFNNRRTQLPSTPGMPPRGTRAQGRGAVVVTDRRAFSDGAYGLVTSDGQQMRVQKLGPEWHILSTP